MNVTTTRGSSEVEYKKERNKGHRKPVGVGCRLLNRISI